MKIGPFLFAPFLKEKWGISHMTAPLISQI